MLGKDRRDISRLLVTLTGQKHDGVHMPFLVILCGAYLSPESPLNSSWHECATANQINHKDKAENLARKIGK